MESDIQLDEDPKDQIREILGKLFSARNVELDPLEVTDSDLRRSIHDARGLVGAISVLAKVSEVLLRPVIRHSQLQPIAGTPGYGPLHHQMGFPVPLDAPTLDPGQKKELFTRVVTDLNDRIGMFTVPEMESLRRDRNTDWVLLYDIAFAQWLLANALIGIMTEDGDGPQSE